MPPIKRRHPETVMVREAERTRDEGYRMLQNARTNFNRAVRRNWEFGMAEARALRRRALEMIEWSNGVIRDVGSAVVDTYGETSSISNAAFRALEYIRPESGLAYTAARFGHHVIARRGRRSSLLSMPSVGSTHSGATEVSQRKMSQVTAVGHHHKSMEVDDVGGERPLGTFEPSVVIRHNKKAHNKKAKRVRVSKVFKEKVQKALKNHNSHGTFSQVSYSQIQLSTNFSSDGRTVVAQPWGVNYGSNIFQLFPGDAYGACGNVTEMVHMLSVLFNQKPDNQGTRKLFDAGNFGVFGTAASGGALANVNYTITAGDILPVNPVLFHVKNMYDVYKIKNNSNRVVNMVIYECKYKTPRADSTTQAAKQSGTYNTVAPYICTPAQMWTDTMADQNVAGVNINNNIITNYGLYMTDCPNVKKYWNIERRHVVMEPGQEYEFKMQGPQGIDINTMNCWSNGTFMDNQKFTVIPVFQFWLDLVSTVDAFPASTILKGVSRACLIAGTQAAVGQGILFERHRVFRAVAPDSTGAVVGAIGGNATFQLNERRNAYFHAVYNGAGGGTITSRFDPQNPVAASTD